MLYTPKQELDNRISRLQAMMAEKGVQGALIMQQADLFYFTGTGQNAHLYVPAAGEPLLLVKKSLDRALQESALHRVLPLGSLKKLPEQLVDQGLKVPETVGLEGDVLPANTYLFFQQVFPSSQMVDISLMIRQVRQIKSSYELDLMRNCARKTDTVFRQIPEMLRERMTECELAGEIEGLARSHGHMGNVRMRAFNQGVFYGNLLTGASGGVVSSFDGPTGGPGLGPSQPGSVSFKKIARGEPIMVDYAGLWDGYIIDQTRLFSIGPLPGKLADAHRVAVEIQEAIVSHCKPGVNGSELHELALKMAEAAGLAEHFMGYGIDRAKFVGHGIGVELDELPVLASGLDTPLMPGMVFALEPKFVFPGEGAVGIENNYVVTETGLERLTLPGDEIIIVE